MATLVLWFKRMAVALIAVVIVACTPAETIEKRPEPIGNFKLGHLIVVANQVKQGPLSRPATQEELVGVVRSNLEGLFAPMEGPKYFNVAVTIDAYILAVPGVPIVASPKSLLIMGLTVYNDSEGTKLMDPPEQIIVQENFSTKSIFGSGLTQSREEQLALMGKAAAQGIHKWMLENEHLFIAATDSETGPVTNP